MNSPSKQNTAIIIVTYNPDSIFLEALRIHMRIVETVIIIDNGSQNIEEWENQIASCELIKSKENKGIGWALNCGINRARLLGKEYVISFDQDSKPLDNILKLYASHIKNGVGLIGTWYNTETSPIEKIHMAKRLTVITSGCLHNLSIIDEIGPYDEDLFIDGVDFDYNIRCTDKGYKVLRSKEPLIAHRLGNPIKKYGIKSSNHSALRKYYIARNNVILSRRYFKTHPEWIIKKNFFFLVDIIKMIFIETDIQVKLKEIFKGIKDGKHFTPKR